MSNNPFDRTILHELEKPLADDINQLETNFDQALRFFIAELFSDPSTGDPPDGFLGVGFLAAAASTPDMTVTVNSGLGFQTEAAAIEVAIDGVPGLNDLVAYKPVPLLANHVFTVPTAPVSPNTRIDIIEVKADRITTDPSTRQVFNVGSGQFEPGTLNKTLAWALDGRVGQVSAPTISSAPLSYVIGQAGAPGAAPSVTPGYIKIAEIAVGSDVVVINPVNITDSRPQVYPTSQLVKVGMVPANGFNWAGATNTPSIDGGVPLASANDVWIVNFSGLEYGDIIEDIVVVFEKTDATSSDINIQFMMRQVDVNPPVKNFVQLPVAHATPNPQTALVMYQISYAEQEPTEFPFEWEEGWQGTIRFDGDASLTCELDSVYCVVRRTLNKQG